MRVAVGTDHGGFSIKDIVLQAVRDAGHEPLYLGAFSEDPVDDYPDYALKVGAAIQSGEADRGILVCGSGIGACIAANKMQGVYASVAHDDYSAAQGVRHDQMNVLCLGGRVVGSELVRSLVHAFLEAVPSTEPRHIRRVGKIHQIEAEDLLRKGKS